MAKHHRPAAKKKKEGNAAKYTTRSKAVRYLQVSLAIFRRLCILKGIFPRDPKKKREGNHKTYYHRKDILFLAHDPLVEKFREIRVHKRKIKKALAKKNKDLADRLLTRQPKYTLHRLILERYPTFPDALRELDDALTMVHLFAKLPAVEGERIQVERIHNCRRLSHEWQAYISRTHSLRKTFITPKGIYYQAMVKNETITWITPHDLQQVLPDTVDLNVMITFSEFYEALLGFVNFTLYHSLDVKYPPLLDPRLEALAEELYALFRYIGARNGMSSGNSQAITSETEENKDGKDEVGTKESELRLAMLQHQLPANERGTLMHLVEDATTISDEDEETKSCKSLFKDLKFFLSREVPRESLLFIIPAFGGVVSWEGKASPFTETDEDITHQIVDRPTQGHIYLSREYVQPQWLFDCINARILLPTEAYMVGRVPPPHISPFVNDEAEGYIPDYVETIKRLQAAARSQVLPLSGPADGDIEDPQNLLKEGVIERTEAIEAAQKKRKLKELENQYHEELEKEVGGITYSASLSDKKLLASEENAGAMQDEKKEFEQIAEDVESLSTLPMSRKKGRLYEAMQIGIKRKQNKNKILVDRKKALGKEK